ncbi:MAG: class I SAM-dependent methyltransferase [Lentisphaeraceae bacterium]|nr:class I SAM-dependent methyltransferase [Lentisphaeraceae bacterium]
MKETNCYFCGSEERKFILSQEGQDPYLDMISSDLHQTKRSWYECLECSLRYRNPTLTNVELTLLYKNYEEDVFKSTTPDEYFDKIISFPPERSENTQKTIWLKQEIAHIAPHLDLEQLRILDVGCGGGTLLYSLKQEFRTSECFGVELNPSYAQLAARRSGATVLNNEFKPNLFGERFDLIILAKVLEHIPEPQKFIEYLASDLRDEGLLFLEVPDIIDFKNLDADHPRFYIPHLFYFPLSVFEKMAEKANLELVNSRTIIPDRGRSYLQVILRKCKS